MTGVAEPSQGGAAAWSLGALVHRHGDVVAKLNRLDIRKVAATASYHREDGGPTARITTDRLAGHVGCRSTLRPSAGQPVATCERSGGLKDPCVTQQVSSSDPANDPVLLVLCLLKERQK